MKSLKTATLGLLAAASLVGTASADTSSITPVHIAGSTAFRSGATAAIIDYLSTGGKTVYAAYDAKGLLSCNFSILANGTLGASGTATTIVECDWTGSLAGLVDLVAQNTADVYPLSTDSGVEGTVNTAPATTSPYGGGTILTSGYATTTANPDFTFSDSVKTTIQQELATASFKRVNGSSMIGSYATPAALAAAVGGSTVSDGGDASGSNAGPVGVVPFEFAIGKITTASYTIPTNMTQQIAAALIGSGFIPQCFLTGGNVAADAAGDSTNYFYLTGRNEDSGTRIDSYSETQYGVVLPPVQYQISGSASGVTSAAEFAANSALSTEPKIYWAPAGHSGYVTGGNVATPLEYPENGSNVTFSDGNNASANTGATYFIGYLGILDASGAVALGVTPMSYNGVPYSATAVENGQYTLWGYEHIYYLPNSISSTALTVENAVADNVYNTDADVDAAGNHAAADSPGVLLKNMLVTRSTTEGGPLSHK